jgi:hypothetical protein
MPSIARLPANRFYNPSSNAAGLLSYAILRFDCRALGHVMNFVSAILFQLLAEFPFPFAPTQSLPVLPLPREVCF